jgi:hypothetical protein
VVGTRPWQWWPRRRPSASALWVCWRRAASTAPLPTLVLRPMPSPTISSCPSFRLELRDTNSRVKSVLVALYPAAATEPGLGGGLQSEDGQEDKQLRTALARVGTLEVELEQTQVSYRPTRHLRIALPIASDLTLDTVVITHKSLQSALRHRAGRVRGGPADRAGPAASHPEHTAAADRAKMSRLRYMALREGQLQMDRSVHVYSPHRVSS